MDRGSAAGSRLRRTACSRWKPTESQKRILEFLFARGTRRPSWEEIDRITADLQGHGTVQAKNVFHWFRNTTAREKRMKDSSSKLHSGFKAPNGTFLFPSEKRSSEKSYVEEEENRRYSSAGPSDGRTLQLFPLHPDL